MHTFKLLLVLSVLFSINYALSTRPNETKNVSVHLRGLGNVVGVVDYSRDNHEFHSFTGVKFAEAPTGENRFKEPIPVKPWSGNFDATKPGMLCPQKNVFQQGIVEDCLHLSVYTRNLDNKVKLPVLVYIHGGGWVEGGATDHPPHYYMDEDIVLVVPQYRLGALGFLSFESSDVPGNVGFLDMIEALNWVQANIEAFGGNPKRVTLAGQGSGASSALLLLHSPLVSKRLFQRVIAQSGSSLGTWIVDEKPRDNARALAVQANCAMARDKDYKVIECLRRTKPSLLVDAYDKFKTSNSNRGNGGLGGSVLTIGGHSPFLNMTPLQSLSFNKHQNVPILAGVTEQEGAGIMKNLDRYLSQLYTLRKGNNFAVLDQLFHVLGLLKVDHSGVAVELISYSMFPRDVLLNGSYQQLVPGLTDVMGLLMVKAPLLREVQVHARYGTEKVYLYSFEYSGQHSRLRDKTFNGVSRSDDNIYFFPHPLEVSKLNEADTQMSKTMVKLWTNFVKTGIPSAEDMPTWEPFSGNLGPYLVIGQESTLEPDFLEEFGATTKLSGANLSSNLHRISFVNLFIVGVIMWLTK